MQKEQKTPAAVTATFSITFPDDGEPMVASRMKVDGKDTKIPYALVLGGLALSEGVAAPEVQASFAQALQSMAQAFALSVIEQAKKAVASEVEIAE